MTICSGIEVVITSTTGNRVVVKSGTRVRISPTAPTKKDTLLRVFFCWQRAVLLHGMLQIIDHAIHGVTHVLHGASHAGLHGFASRSDRHADKCTENHPNAHTAPKVGTHHIIHTPCHTDSLRFQAEKMHNYDC